MNSNGAIFSTNHTVLITRHYLFQTSQEKKINFELLSEKNLKNSHCTDCCISRRRMRSVRMVALFSRCHGNGLSVGSALHRIGRHHVVYLSLPITWTHTVGQTASLSPIRVILEAAASLGRCKKTSWPAWTAHRSSSLCRVEEESRSPIRSQQATNTRRWSDGKFVTPQEVYETRTFDSGRNYVVGATIFHPSRGQARSMRGHFLKAAE